MLGRSVDHSQEQCLWPGYALIPQAGSSGQGQSHNLYSSESFMMDSWTTLKISVLRTHVKGAYQSLLACNGKKKFFLYSATNVTNHLQKNYALL